MASDFSHPPGVAAPFKRCIQESFYNFNGYIFRNKTDRQGQNIGVIMLSGEGSKLGQPTEGSPYALVLIGRHGHPVAAAAHDDAQVSLASADRFCCRVHKIGVIHRVAAIRPEVYNLYTTVLQQLDHTSFVREARVVTADSYGLLIVRH